MLYRIHVFKVREIYVKLLGLPFLNSEQKDYQAVIDQIVLHQVLLFTFHDANHLILRHLTSFTQFVCYRCKSHLAEKPSPAFWSTTDDAGGHFSQNNDKLLNETSLCNHMVKMSLYAAAFK